MSLWCLDSRYYTGKEVIGDAARAKCIQFDIVFTNTKLSCVVWGNILREVKRRQLILESKARAKLECVHNVYFEQVQAAKETNSTTN